MVRKTKKLKYPHIHPDDQDKHEANLQAVRIAVRNKIDTAMEAARTGNPVGEPAASITFGSEADKVKCLSNPKFVSMMNKLINEAYKTK